jgi:hypothetical protein
LRLKVADVFLSLLLFSSEKCSICVSFSHDSFLIILYDKKDVKMCPYDMTFLLKKLMYTKKEVSLEWVPCLFSLCFFCEIKTQVEHYYIEYVIYHIKRNI